MEKEKNTILVVDDSILNQEFLSTIFGDTYNLLKATNGVQGLEVMRENAKIIDVVLLDIVMPGMDGYEVLQVMSEDEDLKYLPVIVVTAESDVKSELKAFQLGAVDFIVRPFNSRLVLQRVSSVLHKRQLENMRTEYELLKKDAENEKIISMMMNNAPGGISMLEREADGTYDFLYCTKGMAELLRYSDYITCMADLAEAPFGMLDEGSKEILDMQVADAIQNKRAMVESTLCCNGNDGSTVWVILRMQIADLGDGKAQIYCFATDITKEKQYETELETSAYTDQLTGIYNRNAFYATAGKQIAEDADTEYAVIRMNVGGFKLINDVMGRETGDKLLLTIADSLRRIAPEKYVYARYHADNFVLLVPTGNLNIEALHSEIKTDINNANIIKHDIQLYMGIFKIDDKTVSIEDMCDRAGIACKSINGKYGAHFAYYDEKMRLAMVEEQEIRDDTRRAIDNNEFVVYYQPVYGIKARRFVSAEALVRWNHPSKGMISPGKFIPVFERNGFIAELDVYVMEQVCKYHQKRRENGLEPFPISVNISRMSLYNAQLFDIISGLTDKYGVEPVNFRIEITESAYNDNPELILETINKLRAKGYPVLMDDFGSGYSSLNTLKDIPIDLLKLDMKFMQGFEENERVKTIVTSIARMSRWLNLPMLAEGVETKEQFMFLKSIGCSYIQGFYFARPEPEREFTEAIYNTTKDDSDDNLHTLGDSAEEMNGLIEGNSYASTLLTDIFDGYAIYEMTGDKLDVVRMDEKYTALTGVGSDDVQNDNYSNWDKIHPNDRDRLKKAAAECVATNRGVKAIVRMFHTDGQMLYVDCLCKRLGGTDENPIFCIGFTNVTRQMSGDTEFKVYYNAAIEELDIRDEMEKYPHCAVLVFNHATNHTVITPSFSMFAAASATKSGDLFEEKEYMKAPAIHPDERDEFREYIKDAFSQEAGKEGLFRMEMADGSYKWCRLFMYFDRDENGKLLKSVCTIDVVHEELMAQKKLEQTMYTMDRVIKNIPVGVGILTVENGKPNPIYSSDQIYKIFEAERSITDNTHTVLAADFPPEVLVPGNHGENTRLSYKEDGTPFWLNTKYNVMEENGELIVYAAIDDVTKQMETERRYEVYSQIHQLLMQESQTVIFDYNTEEDVLTYYPRKTAGDSGYSGPITITHFADNIKGFTLIDDEYKQTVLDAIDRLSTTEATEELAIKLVIDDDSIWYRTLFKSISDYSGKVFRIVGKMDDVDEEVEQINKVRAKAMYDALCVDIYNKATTEELIRAELKHHGKGTLIMLDVDDFKSINDGLGHLFGDEFLKVFATTLKGVFRSNDIVGRYGGDEFLVFLNNDNPDLAKKKAEDIMRAISTIDVPEIGQVNSSIGIAVSIDNTDYVHLMKQADSALYQAKNNGKNCMVLFEPESMDETTFRIKDSSDGEVNPSRPVLSSNPNSFSSLIMRVFSALYTSYDVKSGVDRMLKVVGENFDVSRAYIFENSDDDQYISNTFEWCADGIVSHMDSLQNMSYDKDLDSTYLENWNEDGIFYCHDVTTLREGSKRELLEMQGVKSVIQCAIIEGGRFRGFVGFNECRYNRFWTQEQIDALAFIAKVLSIFLLKERNRRISENHSKSIASILDSHPAFIYVVEPDTYKLLYLNKTAVDALGGDKTGERCCDAICGDSRHLECPIKDYVEKGEGQYTKVLAAMLNRVVTARAEKIEWNGKPAYLVMCMDVNKYKFF